MRILKSITLLFALIISAMAAAESPEYKVVFDLTSGEKKDWETVLNNLENISKELGSQTKLAVVAHGGGIELLVEKSNFQKERMLNLSKRGVQFLGCENTMKRKNIKHSDLYDFVKTVPAGLAEIIRKQKEGWAYIKIGH